MPPRKHFDRIRAEDRAWGIKCMIGKLKSLIDKVGKKAISGSDLDTMKSDWTRREKAKRILNKANSHYMLIRNRGFFGVCQPL